jgi:hypothetical protein
MAVCNGRLGSLFRPDGGPLREIMSEKVDSVGLDSKRHAKQGKGSAGGRIMYLYSCTARYMKG